MALEASGATVVPVGIGQSRRLLDLIPRLGITAIFGTLSFPAHLAARAREAGIDPARAGASATSSPRASRARAWPPCAPRSRRRGAPRVADTFGMSDVWSTMGGACGEGEGLHLTVGDHAVLELIDPDTGEPLPLEDGASGEFVWTHLRREASPLLRYRSGDLGRGVDRRPARAAASTPAHPHRRPPRRHAARAGGERLPAGDRRDPRREDPRLGRHCVVAEGDPIVPPLRGLRRGAGASVDLDGLSRTGCTTALRARFDVTRLEPGSLPVAEHKTRIVHRTARGDALPRRGRDPQEGDRHDDRHHRRRAAPRA